MQKLLVGFLQTTRQVSWLITAALAMLALLIIAGSPIQASAQASNPTFTFPMVAVIEGESIRLNIVNRTGSPGNLPPDVCDVVLKVVDKAGVVRAHRTVTSLAAGQAAHLDLSASSLRDESGKRHELRSFVSVSTRDGSQLPPDVCKPSVEIYDEATGGTKFLGIPPEPDLPPLQ